MVAATTSPKRGQTIPLQKSESPTRVAEFDGLHDTEKENSASDQVSAAAPQNASEVTWSSIKLIYLPTLEETESVSSSETGITPRERSEDARNEYPDEIEMAGDADSDEDARESDRENEKSATVKTSREEFLALKEIASNLASKGREKQALKAYNRALRLMQNDLSKIKRSLKHAHESTIASLQSQLFQAWVQVASEIASMRTTMAILCERLGDYENAIKSCEEARIVYQCYINLKRKVKTGDEDDGTEKLAQVEHMLERLSMARESYDDRKKLHHEAVKVKHRLSITTDPDAKEQLNADLFCVLHAILHREQESLGEMHPQVADTIIRIAQLHADMRETEEAIRKMYTAVGTMNLVLGPNHPRTASALRDLAKMYELRDQDPADSKRAIHLYEATIEAFRGGYGNNHAAIGSLLNNIAVLHIRNGDFDEAVKQLSDALTAYEQGMEHEHAINSEVAQVWKNLGECYSLRQEWESALFAYTSALGVQQDARRFHHILGSKAEDSGINFSVALDGADDASLADTLLRLGNAIAALGQYDEAVETYEEALHIYRLMLHDATALGSGHDTREIVAAQERLAHTLFCIAEVQEKNVKYDEAVELYTESFDFRLQSDAVRGNNRANMVHCAMCLAGIGSVHMRKYEFTDAFLVFKESLDFLEAHGKFETWGRARC